LNNISISTNEYSLMHTLWINKSYVIDIKYDISQ